MPPLNEAHVALPAPPTLTAAEFTPGTATGTVLPLDALPSWPDPPNPQHHTLPPVATAHVWSAPQESDSMPASSPETATGVVTAIGVVVPLPT
jgi:hypothetical protein